MVNADFKKKKKKQTHIGLVCPDELAWLKGNAQQAELRKVTAKCIQRHTHIHMHTYI